MEKMRIIQLIAMISTLVLIIGCSNKNIVTEMEDKTDTPKESIGDTYGFTIFNLTIDTKDTKNAIVTNYDEQSDKTEAIYENKMEEIFLHGNKAMDKLDTIFNELSLEPDMDAEDMIKKASEAFEVIEYTTLKLDVKFKGHDTKKLMMSK